MNEPNQTDHPGRFDPDGRSAATGQSGGVASVTHQYHLFDQAPAYIALHEGPEHVYIFSNPLHDQIIGHRKVLGKKLREAVPELEGQGIFERFDEVFRSGEPSRRSALEATFPRRAGGHARNGLLPTGTQSVARSRR